MKTWKINNNTAFTEESETLTRPKGMIKVRITRVALSSTDIAVYNGSLLKDAPITPGRIAVGFISEADEDSGFTMGNKVLLTPYCFCNSCTCCNIGKNTDCENIYVRGVDIDGYLSDYVIVNPANVFLLPDSVKDEDALFCEHIAIAMKTINILNIDKGEYVVIDGIGVLSLIFAQLVSYYQAIPIVIDCSESKLKLAESFGIDYIINSQQQDPSSSVYTITGGKRAEKVIYESRSTEPSHRITSFVKNNGKIAIIGYNTYCRPINYDLQHLLKKQVSIVGINNAPHEFTTAINALATKIVNVSTLISKRISVKEFKECLIDTTLNTEKYTKIIIDCN